jgi:transcriptional regulator of acetoin/glycerol metabolism
MIFEQSVSNIKECSMKRRIGREDFRRLSLALGHNRLDCDIDTIEFIYELLMQLEETNKMNRELKMKLAGANEKVTNIGMHYNDMKKKPIARKDYITKEEVIETLKRCNGDKGLTATVMGCSRQTIYNRLKEK